MKSQTLPFSQIVVNQIIQEIFVSLFDFQIITEILTGIQSSKQFYGKFINQTVQQALRSTVFPNKNSQFQLLQRPKRLIQIDEEPFFNPDRNISLSLHSKILIKKSLEKSHIYRPKSVKTIKSIIKTSKNNLLTNQSNKNQQKIQNSLKNLKGKKSISLKVIQKDNHLIKLKTDFESKIKESANDSQKRQSEIRKQKSQQNSNYNQKVPIDCKKITNKCKSLPCENFPLLQNVNPIKITILEKQSENNLKFKKGNEQLINVDRNTKNGKFLQPTKSNGKIKSFSESKINTFAHSLDIKKYVVKPQKNSLIILGARQRRASQFQIHSKIIKKFDECKTKNILKIYQNKKSQDFTFNTTSKKCNQKITINSKEKADILLGFSNQKLTCIQIQSGIPNLTQEEKEHISIKLI